MYKIILIGIGGFIGSSFRYLISGAVQKFSNQSFFPVGTLAVNLIGCILIGFLAGLSESRQLFSDIVRSFIFIGVLGGFTTFSTFGYESFSFLRDGQIISTLINVSIHVILGIIFVWLGFSISKIF